MTMNDLEPSKKGFLINFPQFLTAAHISTANCDKMAGDRLDQNKLRMKFLALTAYFNSPDPFSLRWFAQASRGGATVLNVGGVLTPHLKTTWEVQK